MRILVASLLGLLCSGPGTCAAAPAASDTAELIARCAPKVDIETFGAIVRTESSGHVFVLSDDGPRHLPWRQRKRMLRSFYPASADEAAATARKLIADGHLVGIGLTQISSQNLGGLGVSIEQLLDPCTNLSVGARLLRTLYQQAVRSGRYASPQRAVGAAISAYNTGNFNDGFKNGYVSKVLANMSAGIPRLRTAQAPTRVMRSASVKHLAAPASGANIRDRKLLARHAPLEVDL